MTIDLSQFHQVFFDESLEGLDAMESALLEFDVAAPDMERINEIFRAAHSINQCGSISKAVKYCARISVGMRVMCCSDPS